MKRAVKTMPDYTIEAAAIKAGKRPVAGVDEAGRGPWCGPVVAAAVVLDQSNIPVGLNDSKKLSQAQREKLFDLIMKSADVGIGIKQAAEIDRTNILVATLAAMQHALTVLYRRPEVVLVDGKYVPPFAADMRPVIRGDATSQSIAAASIIAKVTRDRIMVTLAIEYPDYGFERHKGYGTEQHRIALRDHGITPQHRKTFKPIRDLLIRDLIA